MVSTTDDPYASTPSARALTAVRGAVRRLGLDVTRYPSRLGYEWQLMMLLRRLRIDCVLDVGANEGQFASFLRRAGFEGHIISFEPIPEIFARLERRMGSDPRWRGMNCALGDADGEAEINVTGSDAQASSLLPLNEVGPQRWGDALRVVRTVPIKVCRLDAVLDEVSAQVPAPRRIYLKMDTQGYDLKVVEGLGSRISEIAALQSEVSCTEFYEGMPRFTDALQRYLDLGYAIVGIFPLSRELDQLRVIEFDVMMMRPGADNA